MCDIIIPTTRSQMATVRPNIGSNLDAKLAATRPLVNNGWFDVADQITYS